jgi:potassium efflux system protein
MGWRACVVWGMCLSLFSQDLPAQPSGRSDDLTIPALQKQIKFTLSDSEMAPAVKEKVLQYFQESLERIEISQASLERADQFERRLPMVADALRSTENRLAASPMVADPSIVMVNDTDELDRLVESRSRHLDDADSGLRKQIANLEVEATLRRTRPTELMNELAEVEDRLREINDEFEHLATSGESGELIKAHRIFLKSRRQRAESERQAIQAETAWIQSPVAAELLKAQRELATRELTVKVAELEILQAELGKRRGDEADQRVHQAENAVAHVSLELQPLAKENLALAKERRVVTHKLRDTEQQHEKTSAALLDLEKEFKRTQDMVAAVGLTDSIGLLLRQQRAKLLDTRGMRSNLAHRADSVRETKMRQFQLDADRAAMDNMDALTTRRAEELDAAKEKKSIAANLRALLVQQRELSEGLNADYSKVFIDLIELDRTERHLLELTTKYADFVDERVLWIRTGQTFGSDHFATMTSPLGWITDPKLWQAVIDAGKRDMKRNPVSWVIAAILFVVWLLSRPLLIGLIRRQGLAAAEAGCRELWPTLQTIAATLGIAVGWPVLLWFVGWRLDHSNSTISFVHGMAAGLLRAATFALPLEVMRIVCLRGGLAERHFDWPQASIDNWRRNVSSYLPVGLLLIGLIGLIEGSADEHRLDSFGRLTFLVFAMLSAIFSQQTIRRARARTTPVDGAERDGDIWADRFWRFAPLLAVVASTGLLILGWSGFFYTALQLTWRLQRTAWLGVGLLLLRATVRRWIALERRRMAVLQDEELQTIADAGREPGNGGHNQFLFPRWTWPDFRLNLTQIVTQMRRLLDTGLITLAVIGMWFVWADVTPALNILDRFTLWQTTVDQVVTSEDPVHGPSVQTIKRPQRVTAADLGLAGLVIAIAVIAGRNIPGLVEVILLEHLSVDAGARFAATCLVRYAIFVAGVCCAFARVSIGWSNVQWLVAAASVGLGFGLQEIFANFVSGIILLFERPMRVGDVITIGDTTGTVSRIRFRATTIVDGDRKELIVPNKEFITGKLLNWTLSDRVNRVGIKIMVGSHNDPQRIRRMLLEIASQHPQLLKDPAPSATLEELAGGLTFMLRAFLPTLEGRATAITDLYTAIHHRFEIEEIEMPCPTQEVIVRMSTHDAHPTTSPPAPHQSPGGGMNKPLSADFGSSFRRT